MAVVATRFADCIVDEFGHEAASSDEASSHRAAFRPARWMIRDQDLNLIDGIGAILEGTATGVALGLTTGSLGYGMIAPALAVLTNMVKLAINMRNKGVTLDNEDFLIMTALRDHPSGASVVQLQEALGKHFHDKASEDIEVRLERLARYPARAGQIELAWKDADGVWRTKDV
jgi:hypothetical protein